MVHEAANPREKMTIMVGLQITDGHFLPSKGHVVTNLIPQKHRFCEKWEVESGDRNICPTRQGTSHFQCKLRVKCTRYATYQTYVSGFLCVVSEHVTPALPVPPPPPPPLAPACAAGSALCKDSREYISPL